MLLCSSNITCAWGFLSWVTWSRGGAGRGFLGDAGLQGAQTCVSHDAYHAGVLCRKQQVTWQQSEDRSESLRQQDA